MVRIDAGITVLPAWTDYNGHFNVAYYAKAFDLSATKLADIIGLEPETTRVQRCMISYSEEAHVGASLIFEWRVMAGFEDINGGPATVSRIAMFSPDVSLGASKPIAVQERLDQCLNPSVYTALSKLIEHVGTDPFAPRGWDRLQTVPMSVAV